MSSVLNCHINGNLSSILKFMIVFMSRNHSNLKSRGQKVTLVIKIIEKNAFTINFVSVRHTSILFKMS